MRRQGFGGAVMKFLSKRNCGFAALALATCLCTVVIGCTRNSATPDQSGASSNSKPQDKLAPELRALYQAWVTTGASGPAQAELPGVMVVGNRVAIEASAET